MNERFNRTIQEEFLALGNFQANPVVFNQELTEYGHGHTAPAFYVVRKSKAGCESKSTVAAMPAVDSARCDFSPHRLTELRPEAARGHFTASR